MKTKMCILLALAFGLNAYSKPKQIEINHLPWVKSSKNLKTGAINICGNNKIQLTASSIEKNFLINDKGFYLSGLVSHQDYWQILKTKNKIEAQESLKKAFEVTRLWQVTKNGEVKSLGAPKILDTPFTATVKDCVEGAKTTLGTNCSRFEEKYRVGCCSEKFQGPTASWETELGVIRLVYSPDPSVHLIVPKEKTHRYCNVVDSVVL